MDGNYAQIKFPSGDGRQRSGGGLRGEIREYTRQTRKRFLDFINSIPTKNNPLPLFITLTYPDNFPKDRHTWKRDLEAMRRRFKRKLGRVPFVWRLEFVDRKSGENKGRMAPHFHILMFADVGDLDDLRQWLSLSWYEVCGELHPDHLKAGTNCKPVESWHQVRAYAAKYMGKPEQLAAEIPSTGKLWGVTNKQALGIQFEEVSMSFKQSLQMRRALRRKHKLPSRSQTTSFSVYTAHQGVEQLAEYYAFEEWKQTVGRLLLLSGVLRGAIPYQRIGVARTDGPPAAERGRTDRPDRTAFEERNHPA